MAPKPRRHRGVASCLATVVMAARAAAAAAEPGIAAAAVDQEPWAGRCSIRRVALRPGELPTLPRTAEPYIVRLPGGRNEALRSRLEREALLSEMGDATCTPSQAGSIRTGIEEMPLREYIQQWMSRRLSRHPEENRYVFGEFGEQWAPLREAYVRPPCFVCDGSRVAVTIGLGGLHSGAPWHFHDGAFVEVLHGRKHFALLPPSAEVMANISEQIKGLSMFHWHLEERPALERAGLLGDLRECALQPGELLYSPDGWHHGVVNLDHYTAFVSSFLERGQDPAQPPFAW